MAKKDKKDVEEVTKEVVKEAEEFVPEGQYFPTMYDTCPKDEMFYEGDKLYYSYEYNKFFAIPKDASNTIVEHTPCNFQRTVR